MKWLKRLFKRKITHITIGVKPVVIAPPKELFAEDWVRLSRIFEDIPQLAGWVMARIEREHERMFNLPPGPSQEKSDCITRLSVLFELRDLPELSNQQLQEIIKEQTDSIENQDIKETQNVIED